MTPLDGSDAIQFSDAAISKRQFLGQLAAAGAAAILWPGDANAVMELWESGDPLCVVPYPTLDKPDGYELDLAYLETFIAMSAALTGVAPLDRHLANQYMERYATHPQISKNLDILVKAYRGLAADKKPQDGDIKQGIMMSSDGAVRAGAKQLIYLWYTSAFFIPLDAGTDPNRPLLQDDPADTRKKAWVYGTPEQYEHGLMWKVISAHAPMTPGGPRRYWATAPIL
ncbi:twin-arginine translocation signal domain-containing protein [Bradyrhizobium sp.]|uniref:twin-arginine translocation signal domain-containing protein n=1 Tax=Bradyrhizobium sp. TaxID=376 RepID=UPI003C731F12